MQYMKEDNVTYEIPLTVDSRGCGLSEVSSKHAIVRAIAMYSMFWAKFIPGHKYLNTDVSDTQRRGDVGLSIAGSPVPKAKHVGFCVSRYLAAIFR